MLLHRDLGVKEFLTDFWNMILERFQADFSQYPNLGISERSLENLRIGVIAFFSAIMIAAVVISVKRNLFGTLVQRLIGMNCCEPKNAKTVEELGLRKNFAVKAALRLGGQYRGMVRCIEEDAYTDKMEKMRAQNSQDYAEGKAKNPYVRTSGYVYHLETDRFYIAQEDEIKASRKFDRKGTGVLSLILILVISFLAMLLIIFFLPDFVQLLDNFVGILKNRE